MKKKFSYLWGVIGLVIVLGAFLGLLLQSNWEGILSLDKMDRLTYLNQVVERANTMLEKMEASFESYVEVVPIEVKTDSEIEVNAIRKTFLEAQQYLVRLTEIQTLGCRDESVKQQVVALYPDYYQAAQDYLDLLSEVISFYSQMEFKGKPAQVAEYDESLQKSYYHFVQEHNHLANFLNSVGEGM